MSHRQDLRRVSVGQDVVGLTLLASLGVWTLLSAQLRGGNAADIVASLAIVACGYFVGRLTSHWSWAVSILVLCAFCCWTLATPGALDGGPLAGPLGYGNANAALAVQVTALALVAAARGRRIAVRLTFLVASVLPLAVAWANGSTAAIVLGAVVVGVGFVVALRLPDNAIVAVTVGGGLVTMAVVGQLLIAAGVGNDSAAQVLSERRIALWSDAVELTCSEPLLGHGPQSFATASPTAATDSDTQAAHSALLETAAETGLVSAGLLLLLVVWAFIALARAGDPGPAAVGAAAWTAFAVHSLVDYIADFPAVVIVAALVLGLAVGPYRQRSSTSPKVSHQPVRVGG